MHSMKSHICISFIIASYLTLGVFGSAEIWRTFPFNPFNAVVGQLRDFYSQSLQSVLDGAQETTTFNGVDAIQESKIMIKVPLTSYDEKRGCITQLTYYVVNYCVGYDRCKINVSENCRLIQSPGNFQENSLLSDYSAAMGSNAPSIIVDNVINDHTFF